MVNPSTRKPANSEPVDLSTTRSRTPLTTWLPSASTTTSAVRTSGPVRRNPWSWSAIRSQPNSSMRTSARETGATSSTKCRARRSANSSISPMPASRANAKTVFFWVSVGSTAPWSPATWAAEKSPESEVDTLRSRMACRSVSRSIRKTRVSAFP